MGKRRRYQKKPHFCSSENIVKPYSPNYSTTGLNTHTSLAQVYQNGMSRSMLLRHARNHPINHYSHQALRSNVDSLNLLNNNTISLTTTHDIVKALCGICLNLLKKKPYQDEVESSNELSVVAILVCGHVYHGDCLDKKTSEVDKSDPPCPICFESITMPS
ncbi:hypothetical protein MKW92_010206 [Papaver armeniacum]|nr:hypothetical protein MKW92_010206 [Papaver armeniacum]